MKTNSSTNKPTSIEERALVLLGAGLSQIKVAESLGVDPSRISQLVTDEEFSKRLADAKFENLNKHNEHDAKLDRAEDAVVDKLLDSIDQVYKPMELTRILATLNAAKRRGSSAPASVGEQSTILNLLMPTKIINNFVTNINNQVVRAGETDLLTIQSGTLADKVKQLEKDRVIEYESRTKQRVGELLDSLAR
jgi:transcriptional regulator with XRE-family HTH domain